MTQQESESSPASGPADASSGEGVAAQAGTNDASTNANTNNNANAGEGDSPQVQPGESEAATTDTSLLDQQLLDLLPDSIQAPLQFMADYPLLLLLVVVFFGYLLGKLLQFILGQVGTRLADRTKNDYDDQLLLIARKPALTFPVILSLFLVTALVPIPEGLHGVTVKVLATVLLLSALRAALKAAHVLLQIVADREDKFEIVEARTVPMFEITSKVVLVAMAGYGALLIWGIDPTAWLASAGVIGIAVGFAARDTLANLFSGIFIVADAPYKIGDYVVLDTGERGEVTHVGLRSTRLLTRDDIEVTIPNAIIANAKIINESGGPWEKYRIRIPVGVAYGSDVDQVEDVLKQIAHENADILDDPAPRVRMRGFGDSSLNFELLGWVLAPVHRGRVSHEMFKAVYKRFQAEGIQIPFPQRDVYLRKVEGEERNE